MQKAEELPEPLASSVAQAERFTFAFLNALRFVVQDASRDPGYFDSHILSYAAQDYIQSTMAFPLLIREGIHNVVRRELRFLLEMSIKICRIQQQDRTGKVEEKLTKFIETFDTTNISMQKQLPLKLLPDVERTKFIKEVGRIYGETSSYVHWTSSQVAERIDLVDAGRTSGFESADDVDKLAVLLARTLSCCLVFLLHSVPEYVSGDLLVEIDGSSRRWAFSESMFLAHMDEYFDYKHERQKVLDAVKRARWSQAKF